MNKEEFIQNYIANRLSEADKVRAEELLKTDVELQELYETHQEMTAAFKLSNDKALKKRFQELDAIDTSETTTHEAKKFNFGMLGRIAIAAIFIVGAFFAINQFSSDGGVFESYFEVCPNTYLPITRGTTTQDAQFEAFKAYESGNYLKAATAFKNLLASDNNSSIQFYYAMSLMNQEKYDLALQELNNLTKENFDYQIESLWYAALIEIKKKNVASAEKHLQTLQQLNPTYKKEEIEMILEKLQSKKTGNL
ncbi:tetratricopeptide repeat protein [Kordia sp.]|uniref:tetratricopeptide repeat protein n=1 Tax=Kordia sp. TaxID=1965332 RepID=UPI003D6B5E43